MKKWLAALLVLCLTLTLAPAALAEGISEAVDAPVSEVELELGAAETEAETEEVEAAGVPANANVLDGWVGYNGDWYYYVNGKPASGVMGVLAQDPHDGWFYFEPGTGKVLTGWRYDTLNSAWRYFNPEPNAAGYRGIMAKERWVKTGAYWYYVGSNAMMATGWQQIGGDWYYFGANGVMATGWQQIGGKWYYFKASGAMHIGWLRSGRSWYYFEASGAMVTDWQKIGGSWYFFNADGAMRTGWLHSGSSWYYFCSSGAMATGWQKIDGLWYYFSVSGRMVTGWLQLGSDWYYFDLSGAMATGMRIIDGETYFFNPDGTLQTVRYDRSKDLRQYLWQDIFTVANKLGLKTEPDGSIDWGASDDNISLFALSENNNLISRVRISGKCEYNIAGVTYGMAMGDAQKMLTSQGYTYYTTYYEVGLSYIGPSGDEVTINNKNGRVSLVTADVESHL